MKAFLRLFLLLVLTSPVSAQIESVDFYADYAKPLTKRLQVNKIDGVGGGLEIQLKVYDFLSVSLAGGYELYSLQQDNAIAQWDWKFWDQRYRGIVRADTAADPNLKATLEPVQKMDIIPLMLNVNADFEVLENFFVKPSAGGGVIFYTRRLYLHEYWEKRFSGIDYTFEYDYMNFAQDKTGNPYFLSGSLELEYRVTDYLKISSGVRYIKMIATPGKYGYNEFPFEDALNIKLGLSFLY